MFDIRVLDNDYNELLDWWKWFRFPAPAQEFLPENGNGGLMVSKNGVNICVGFIYYTNSKIAWLEYVVSNPNYKEKDRTVAIEYLIYCMANLIQDTGYKAIFTSVKNENLIKRFENVGFSKGTNNTTEMILKL